MRYNLGRSAVAYLFVTGGAVLLSAACDRRDDKALGTERNPPSVRGQRAEAIGSAVDSIVEARCDREARCNNIGANHKYTSRDACMNSTARSGGTSSTSSNAPAA